MEPVAERVCVVLSRAEAYGDTVCLRGAIGVADLHRIGNTAFAVGAVRARESVGDGTGSAIPVCSIGRLARALNVTIHELISGALEAFGRGAVVG